MSAIAATEGVWRSPSSSHTLAYRLWQPPESRASLLLLHGFGEHGGRYEPVARQLAEQGIAVAVPDLPGHGRSSGRRGDLGDLVEVSAVLEAMAAERLAPAWQRTRYAIFGHSFGGLLAIRWALSGSAAVTRLIAQAPLLEVGFEIPEWKRAAASLLGRVLPMTMLSMDLDPSGLSHDEQVVVAYRSDPLVHNRMSAGSYRSILAASQEVRARPEALLVPCLLLYGSADRIVSVPELKTWYARVRCPKRCIEYPGAFHELHHEPVREQVIQAIVEWVRHA